jgi:hypothetical protein
MPRSVIRSVWITRGQPTGQRFANDSARDSHHCFGTALPVGLTVAVGGGGAIGVFGVAVGGAAVIVTTGFGVVGAGAGLNVGAGFGVGAGAVVTLCDGATPAISGMLVCDADGSEVGTSSANTGLGRIAALPGIGSAILL